MKSLLYLQAAHFYLLNEAALASSSWTPLVKQELELQDGDEDWELDDGTDPAAIDDCRVHGCAVEGQCCGLAYANEEELFAQSVRADGLDFKCAHPDDTFPGEEGLPDQAFMCYDQVVDGHRDRFDAGIWGIVGIVVSLVAGALWAYVAMAGIPIFFGIIDMIVGLCGMLGPQGTMQYF